MENREFNRELLEQALACSNPEALLGFAEERGVGLKPQEAQEIFDLLHQEDGTALSIQEIQKLLDLLQRIETGSEVTDEEMEQVVGGRFYRHRTYHDGKEVKNALKKAAIWLANNVHPHDLLT